MGPRVRRSWSRPLVAALAVLVATAAVGCSDDETDDAGPDLAITEDSGPGTTGAGSTTTAAPVEPGTADEYEAALLTSLRDDPDNASLMDADQAGCVAPEWVAAITPERFGRAGVAPADLAEQTSMSAVARLRLDLDEAESLITAMGTCGVDLRGRALEQTRDVNGNPLDADGQSCLETNLTEDLVTRYAAVSLTGDSAATEAADVAGRYLQVLQDCGVYLG